MRSQDNSSTTQTNISNNSSTLTGTSGEQQQQTSTVLNSSSNSNQNANWTKIQALKQRKCELEKLLNEKNLLLQQIQKQEAQIIGERSNLVEQNCNVIDSSGNNTILRRKVGTSYKLPKNLLNCKEDGDIEKLLLDKKIQQEICNAAFKLANDPNISKSIRRTHKAEYEAAQQKLIAIHQNLSILKKRPLTQTKSISFPNSTTPATGCGPTASSTASNPTTNISNVNLTKSPSIQHSSPDLTNKQCNNVVDNFNNNNKYGNSNSVNSFYTTERRNSMKLTTVNDASTLLVDRTLKNHRSDYDINRLVPAVTTENNRVNSNNCFSPSYNNYFYNNYTIQQQQRIDDVGNYNNNYPHQELGDGGSYFGSNNNSVKYINSKVSNEKYISFPQNHQQYDDNALAKLSTNGQNMRQSYNLSGIQSTLTSDDQQYIVGVFGEKNFYGQISNNNTSKKYDTVDTISVSPSTVTSLHDQHIGLGGYWRTLPNNERVWCAVENCYESNGTQQQNKPKNINVPMTTKASSLGNFDVITTKDESVDQISISSMNSETSKRTKEKQWLETSLDSPLIRSKPTSTTNEIGSRSLPHTAYNTNAVTGHQHSLSPTFNTYNLHTTTIHTHHHPHKHHKYGNRSKLSSQSMSNNSYRPTMTKLEDQTYLSHSTSVLNNNSNENQFNQRSLITIIPSSDQQSQYSNLQQNDHLSTQFCTISPDQLSPNNVVNPSSTYNTLKTTRSPIITNINKTSDIRIESPKNMTVIQQATFMPYKEVTKPFEMSDFYKYSIKFRQKESKQQQSQTCVTAIPSVVADVN